MAVAEHVASLCAAAAALRLPVDIPDQPDSVTSAAVRPAATDDLGTDARAAIDEIAGWAHEQLGIAHAPLLWRTLARMPRMMVNTWRKDRLVMSPGRLDELTKACAAFAVAANRQSPYMIAYTTARLRAALGLDEDAVVELVTCVMHYVSFNTISHAMLLEPPQTEMRAADFDEG